MTNNFQRLLVRSVLAAMNTAVALSLTIHPAQAQTFKVLYRFTGGTDGYTPSAAPLIVGGTLYGTTLGAGVTPYPNGYGTVFSLDLQRRVLTTLHVFAGAPADGASPAAEVINDSVGNLYGTTSSGGSGNHGSVFEITSAGTLILLHSFSETDGGQPASSLVFDSATNLYGTTCCGGEGASGTIFKLDPSSTLTTLYNFGAVRHEGFGPEAGLLLEGGVLYGTTSEGGVATFDGTVFDIDVTGGTLLTLHRFRAGPGGRAKGFRLPGVIGDGTGKLYGVTPHGGQGGGRAGLGVVFRLNIATGKETVLHTFTGNPDGAIPNSRLVRDMAGNLYGTTAFGGIKNRGTVFKVDTNGNETILHSFAGPDEGRTPVGVWIDTSGHIYGTTAFGGTGCAQQVGCGTIFEIVP